MSHDRTMSQGLESRGSCNAIELGNERLQRTLTEQISKNGDLTSLARAPQMKVFAPVGSSHRVPEAQRDTSRKMRSIQDDIDRWSQKYCSDDVLKAALVSPVSKAVLCEAVQNFVVLKDGSLPVGLTVPSMIARLPRPLLYSLACDRVFREIYGDRFSSFQMTGKLVFLACFTQPEKVSQVG